MGETPALDNAEKISAEASSTEVNQTVEPQKTEETKPIEPVVEPAKVETATVVETDPRDKQLADMTEKNRRMQSERDMSESRLRQVYGNLAKNGPIDELGNLLPGQSDPEESQEDLFKLAMAGDTEAYNKLQAKNNETLEQKIYAQAKQREELVATVAQTESRIRAEFPTIIKEDGDFNPDHPIMLEAKRMAQEEPELYPLSTPQQMHSLLRNASTNLLQTKFPDIVKKLQEDFIKKETQAGANMSITPSSGTPETVDNIDVDPAQMEQWKKEGYNTPESLARVKKIFTSATNKRGYQVE